MSPIILPEFSRGFHIGPLFIHYYALAYMLALLTGWQLVRRLSQWAPVAASLEQVDGPLRDKYFKLYAYY